QKTSTTSFDATIEVHIRLGIDARQAEQSVRGTVQLPAGTGKEIKVMAFVPSGKAAAAKKAGADFVSDEATLKKIKDGWTGFDVAVATPDQMAMVGGLGKTLGPKGLMPNPKSGTVSDKVEEAIGKVKAGSIEFRVAKDATIHAGIGKASFKPEDLAKNVAAYVGAVKAAKPDDAKGTYIRSVTLASTMGPGVKVNPDAATVETT
ncbi:MAG: 50S ribosomal protein L1, partial [Patescibacteria group bacterium]